MHSRSSTQRKGENGDHHDCTELPRRRLDVRADGKAVAAIEEGMDFANAFPCDGVR